MTKPDSLNILVDSLTEADYGSYYGTYFNQLPRGMRLSEALDLNSSLLRDALSNMSDSESLYRYAPDKWSIREVIMHLIDCERIFNYRALRFARQDKTNLTGFDQDHYAVHADADAIPLGRLLENFELQRRNTQAMFSSFNAEMMSTKGMANDYELSVKALGFFPLAHETHHVNVLNERYL